MGEGRLNKKYFIGGVQYGYFLETMAHCSHIPNSVRRLTIESAWVESSEVLSFKNGFLYNFINKYLLLSNKHWEKEMLNKYITAKYNIDSWDFFWWTETHVQFQTRFVSVLCPPSSRCLEVKIGSCLVCVYYREY